MFLIENVIIKKSGIKKIPDSKSSRTNSVRKAFSQKEENILESILEQELGIHCDSRTFLFFLSSHY